MFVIDDEADIAESLSEILRLSGYEAFAFVSGLEAIDFVSRRCPDIVISDVVMPVLNGVETVLAIKQKCPAARFLLLSGQAATTDILSSAPNQGHEFELLPKPIHPNTLLKKLASFQ